MRDGSDRKWWPGSLSLMLVGLLSACGGKNDVGMGEPLDEFGLPEVDFGKLKAELELASKKKTRRVHGPDHDPDDLYTEVFVVPPTFLSARPEEGESDPFAEGVGAGKRMTAKGVLESYGVVFGPGTAVMTGATSQLIVRQTAEQLELVEKILETLKSQGWADDVINVRIEIYELPVAQALEYQKKAGIIGDCSEQWQDVMRLVKKGSVRFVTSITAMSRSGQRTRSSDVQEFIFLSDFDWQNPEKPKAISPMFKTRDVGTILEVDPQLTTEGKSVDLAFAFEHHSAPPGEKQVKVSIPGTDRSFEITTPIFHTKKITSKITLGDGAVRIIGAWRPSGKLEFEAEDLMHIAFLKMDLQTVFPNKSEP